MTLTIVSWFILGCLAGATVFAIAAILVIEHEGHKINNEEFVKKLIEKKGWTEARWELETLYRGRYMRIWRKLYRKHIEKGENKNEQ